MKSAAQVEQRNPRELIPYANNARTHSDEQVAQIAASIKEFGFNNPILIDKDGGIIAGHGRVSAAYLLGMDTVPTICLDHLSDIQRRAYILADNKLALNAGWDDDTLALEMQGLNGEIELGLLGFTDDEIKVLLNGVEFDPGTEDDQGKLDSIDPKMTTCPHCGEEYDLRDQD